MQTAPPALSVRLLQTFATFLLGMKESTRTFVESDGFVFKTWSKQNMDFCFSPISKGKYLQTDQTVADIEDSLGKTFLDFLLLAIVNNKSAAP